MGKLVLSVIVAGIVIAILDNFLPSPWKAEFIGATIGLILLVALVVSDWLKKLDHDNQTVLWTALVAAVVLAITGGAVGQYIYSNPREVVMGAVIGAGIGLIFWGLGTWLILKK